MNAAHDRAQKRGHYDAFVSGTDAELTDSPRKRRVKADVGHGSYTVDIQRVSVKKKKSTYEDYFSEVPPAGFTYLPVGFRKIKEWCRDECLRQRTLYYVVSLFPRRNSQSKSASNMITKNIYRHGWHFPQAMILAAFQANGLTNQHSVAESRNPILKQAIATPESVTEANLTDLFKDLFPGMPERDIIMVINHAFKQGSGRVGDSEQLQYVRRVQLAVLAHIRHNYTDYDSRLKTKMNSRQLARLNIEGQCLAKLLKWRGEDDEYELEERDEEVLIIEDSDDDSDDELTQWEQYLNGRKQSPDSDIEVVGYRDLKNNKERFRNDLPALFYSPKFAGLAPRRSISRLPQTPQLKTSSLAPTHRHMPMQLSIYGTPRTNAANIQQFPTPIHVQSASFSGHGLRQAPTARMDPSSTQTESVSTPFVASLTQHPFPEGLSFEPSRPLHAAGTASWPRPVTILLDSPSGIPQTVVDSHGNTFSFDHFTHTITPISSPRSKTNIAQSVEHPATSSRDTGHMTDRLAPPDISPKYSLFVGSDGQKYRLVPSSGPLRSASGQPSQHMSLADPGAQSRFASGLQLMPANAHYIDLTLDDSPARSRVQRNGR